MIRLLLTPKIVVGVSLIVALWMPQVLTETSSTNLHTIDKRNVGVLARTGQLPYQQGKRYVASLARSGNLPLYLQKKLHPGMTSRNQMQQDEQQMEPNEKRYIGAMARNGNVPFQFQTKRESMDLPEVDEMEKLKQLEAETKALEGVLYLESQLNLELLKEKLLDGVLHDDEMDEDKDDEKRSMASLARGGNLPYKSDDQKRSVEALARAGYLPATPKTLAARNDNAEEEKRSVSSLAKSGNLKGYHDGKRGGIGSLARNNLLPQKKDVDNLQELEAVIQEMIEEDTEKRNIGSIARGFNLPSNGKRNLGALARGGGYSRFTKSGQDDYTSVDDKRNLASLVRSRVNEGKRYLGALARSQNLPFHKTYSGGYEEKRTAPMAYAKHWNQPENLQYFGKRYYPVNIINNEDNNGKDVAKRYVAALLRQGPLPVGSDENHEAPEPEAKDTEVSEEKRHIGSLKAISKRSIDSQTTDKHGKVNGGRSKRNAYIMPTSEEYPMPNEQNSEMFDYDDLMDVMTGSAAPSKRFLGSVARSGWFRDSNRGFRDSNRGGGGLVDTNKRHIGALARLGWLPQLRSSRYRRFGRAMPSRVCKRSSAVAREDSTDGATSESDAPFWTASSDFEGRPLLDDPYIDTSVEPLWKRYLLLPALDNIILRKLYSRHFNQ